MQISFIGGALKGYASKAMNSSNITLHKNRATIEHRIKVLKFFDRYGEAATREAFTVSRSTVFLWKQRLRDGHGRLESLAPSSKAPKTRRKRNTDSRIADYIVEQREAHPRLGKDKLHELLKPYCAKAGLSCPSTSTIGRILNDLRNQGRLPSNKRLRLQANTGRLHEHKRKSRIKKERRGDYYPSVPGDLVQIDCVIKFISGVRRYIISAIDYRSEFAFSMAYSSLSSAKAKDFLHKFLAVAPFEVKRVQTDNGSEFYKLFHASCGELGLEHFWNYPRSPRMNYQLMDWLLWYNTERPHWTLKLKSPMRALIDSLQLPLTESNMLWTDTVT